MNMKAQFWSFDVIFAIVIFSIALTIIGITWYSLNNQLSLTTGGASFIAQLQAQSLEQNLLSTGTPVNWQSIVNTTNTATWGSVGIGLANSSSGGTLSPKKLYTLMAMANNNYQATKQELGISYDYFIIINSNQFNITIGRNPATHGALSVYVDKRSAFIGSTPVVIEVLVWTNTTLGIS